MSRPVRLYTKGAIVNYRGNLHGQDNTTSLLKIQGVLDKKSTDFYLGKRVAFVYRAQRKKLGASGEKSKIRVMWGKITRPHGNSGTVRAKFRKNLPPKALGATVRVMLYPSRI